MVQLVGPNMHTSMDEFCSFLLLANIAFCFTHALCNGSRAYYSSSPPPALITHSTHPRTLKLLPDSLFTSLRRALLLLLVKVLDQPKAIFPNAI